jgi:hypothetical protein
MDTPESSEEEDGGHRYRPPEIIEASEITEALGRLQLFGDDPSLYTQAFNLAIVDQFLMTLEYDLLRKQFAEEKTPVRESAFLSALSQMWIFAAYELMRTWRQRARNIIKWADNGILEQKLQELEQELGYEHFGRTLRAKQLKRVVVSPSMLDRIRSDMRLTHIPFARMEAVRISLAKHEVRGKKNSVALMPTYARINSWCGSLDFELETGLYTMGRISRRDIADEIRALSTHSDPPTDEQICEFDEFMRGPPA